MSTPIRPAGAALPLAVPPAAADSGHAAPLAARALRGVPPAATAAQQATASQAAKLATSLPAGLLRRSATAPGAALVAARKALTEARPAAAETVRPIRADEDSTS